jgi:hypothetical protein
VLPASKKEKSEIFAERVGADGRTDFSAAVLFAAGAVGLRGFLRQRHAGAASVRIFRHPLRIERLCLQLRNTTFGGECSGLAPECTSGPRC